jgi:hypothetical protein
MGKGCKWHIVNEHENIGTPGDDLLQFRTDRLALLVNMFVEMEIGCLSFVERQTLKRVSTDALEQLPAFSF